MKNLEIITANAKETKKTGEILAQELLKENLEKKSIVIGLEGELGGGKTTFIQGLVRGLGIREKITSPTFVVLKKYKFETPIINLSVYGQILWFYHIDCYRLTAPKDLIDLDFQEIISQPKNIVAIEWADRVKSILPKDSLWVKFKYMTKKERLINLKIGN